jgi:hypothetical protein
MSVLPEAHANQASPAINSGTEHLGPIHLEPRFVPATDSQLLIIETGLRLLSAWAVRAAGSAERAATST